MVAMRAGVSDLLPLLTSTPPPSTRCPAAEQRVGPPLPLSPPSLLSCRPGRLELHIHVPLPGAPERLDILRVHTRRTPLGPDVDLHTYAADGVSGGWSGAALANLVREAGMEALREDIGGATVTAVHERHMRAALATVRATML